jgi:hypothetical protein
MGRPGIFDRIYRMNRIKTREEFFQHPVDPVNPVEKSFSRSRHIFSQQEER